MTIKIQTKYQARVVRKLRSQGVGKRNRLVNGGRSVQKSRRIRRVKRNAD